MSVTFDRLLLMQSMLINKMGFKNIHQVPKINKIVVHSGINCKQIDVKNLRTSIRLDLQLITNSKPAYSKAKTSIANFNIKRGDMIGYKATLRGKRLFNFLDKLLEVTTLKIKSLSVLNVKSFDNAGNITFGVPDYSPFSDETSSIVARPLGMNITLQLKSECLLHSIMLLRAIGFTVLM
ncbi:MAG: 50S ribosomal protein L5 [Candidatus Hodgkinia cicadicola]